MDRVQGEVQQTARLVGVRCVVRGRQGDSHHQLDHVPGEQILASGALGLRPRQQARRRLVDAIVAYGDVDALHARVREHFAAGADHVCVQVLTGESGALPLPQWRELAPALVGG